MSASAPEIEIYTGIVVTYNRAGYGWLDCDGNRIWVHIQDTRDANGRCLPALKVGQQFRFNIVNGPKGVRAKNARAVEASGSAEGPANVHTV